MHSPYLFNVLAEMVTRETLDGFQGRMITNLRHADDIILLATSEAELQELMDRLDRVSRRYSLLINIDKTKVMTSDGIACRILIQNEQLAQVNTFPYLGSLLTEDGECMTEFCTRLSRGQAIGASLHKIWKSYSIPITTKTRLMKALVWPVVMYGCEETRELPGERNNARNNGRCTQARKTTHGLDRQHQVVDRTLCGRVDQNDRG